MLDDLPREMQTQSRRNESRPGPRGIFRIACLSLLAMVMVLSCRQTAGPVTLPSGGAALAGNVYLELGPMIGHVGPDEARIWVKASGR